MLTKEKYIQQLYLQFLCGDDDAFSPLYNALFDDLMHYGWRLSRNQEVVEDAIQDLFLKLYQKSFTLNDTSRLKPFLFRALKNTIYNQLIRNARSTELNIENLEFTLSYTIEEKLFSQDKYALTDEVKNIMDSLTERQKEIIYLRFIHDMTIDEIAQIMDINTQSARNLISRSLQKLRESSTKVSIIILI